MEDGRLDIDAHGFLTRFPFEEGKEERKAKRTEETNLGRKRKTVRIGFARCILGLIVVNHLRKESVVLSTCLLHFPLCLLQSRVIQGKKNKKGDKAWENHIEFRSLSFVDSKRCLVAMQIPSNRTHQGGQNPLVPKEPSEASSAQDCQKLSS